MIHDDLKLTGALTIALNDEVVQETENLVVTTGKNWVADRMNDANTVMTHMAVGTGTATALAANTALAFPSFMPSTKWSRLPTPPEAINGMFTSDDIFDIKSIS